MTQPFDLSNIPRDSRRVPITTRVTLSFERFSGFISEYSSNISPTGMFITTESPEPAGSEFDFAFRLGDGFEIIQGKGEVVWTRAVAEGPNRPAGMGIRFLQLSEGSKELIYRIVDQYIQDGGTPFDVSLRPPDPVRPAILADPEAEPEREAEREAPAAAVAAAPSYTYTPTPLASPDPAPSGWLPPVDGLAPAPPSSFGAEAFGADETYLPSLAEAPAPIPVAGAIAGSGSVPQKSRSGLWAALGLALALLLVAGFFFRDSLTALAGGSGGDEVQGQAGPPPVRRQAEPAAPTGAQEATVEEDAEPAQPLPEVVRRKPAEEAPAPAAAPAAATAAPAGPPLSALERITWEEAFGGTDIILWGNGSIPADVYSQSRMSDPPRELIKLTGIRRPFGSAKVAVGTSEIKQVRIGYHANNELHVVLDLADPRIKVTRIEPRENHLRIHLQGQ